MRKGGARWRLVTGVPFLEKHLDRCIPGTTTSPSNHRSFARPDAGPQVTQRADLPTRRLRRRMREFMHYITNAFYSATNWNEDNTYKELNSTARELIDFPLPVGLRLTLSSLATPHFATSYQLGSVGIVDGSISYLHTSVPLTGVPSQSDRIPLPALLKSYRELHELGALPISTSPSWSPFPLQLPSFSWKPSAPAGAIPLVDATRPRPKDPNRHTLLYGRLYLPQSQLEGLIVKRLSPSLQVQLSAVSEQSLRNGGTLLGLIQYDRKKYGIEGLASTDGGLLGIRGLYNFGGDAVYPPSNPTLSPSNGSSPPPADKIYGRFSAGGELYYGTLNKSGGMSLGARFATLPTHRGTPLTATVTVNPLMGNINTTYAVLAKDYCSLATRMEFNVYSYESDWAVGMELWSNRRPAGFLLGPEPLPERAAGEGVKRR
ncbi:mitochondrial distribution and morphology protein 10, partial [Podospora aff. communis PSN243]